MDNEGANINEIIFIRKYITRHARGCSKIIIIIIILIASPRNSLMQEVTTGTRERGIGDLESVDIEGWRKKINLP